MVLKMKRKFRLLFIALFMFFAGFSQTNAIISGRIIDQVTKQSLPFASVTAALKSDGKLHAGTVSKEDGRFILENIPQGDYILKIAFIGYSEKEIPVLIGKLNSVFDLGKIELKPQNENLNEVTIEARKAAVTANFDKKVFDVSSNVAQTGGSVLDVMKTMPGVSVSQDGKVILRGSDKEVILMDGKQSSLTGYGNQKGLDNIPASNIEKIEIINNPSAKYDASGMAGIINIIYKKETQIGLNGDIGLNVGIGALSKPKNDLPTQLGSYDYNPKLSPSLNLNYKTRDVNFFLQSEVLGQKKLPNNEFTTRNYTDGRRIVSQVPENRTQIHYIVNGGMDWNINKMNSMTFSVIYDWERHIDTAQVPFIDLSTQKRLRYWNWKEDEITGYMNYAVNFKHKFEQPGHEFRINAQYTKGWEDESYHLNDSSAIRQKGSDATHILATEHTTGLSFDYVKPLRSGRIETGAKFQNRTLPVEYTITPGTNSIIYPGMGNWSDWGENILAGYVNYILEKSKFDIEGGLRAEYTKVYYDISPENIYYKQNDSYDYFEFFPNIRITSKLNARNSVSAYFNRRIDRPGEPELRIFPKYDDPELLKVGNPYLRPQFTQSFELAYKRIWNSGSVFLSGYYRSINDPFMRVYSIDNSNSNYDIVNKIYQNTGHSTNTGFEVLVSQQVSKPWKLSGSINAYENVNDAYQGLLLFPYERSFSIEETSDLSWDFKLNNQILLPKKIQIQLTAIYYSPKNLPQGKQYARSSIDAGFKKAVFKGKGEFTFSASDILNNFGIKQEFTEEGFLALYENYFETQVFRIGLKYKL